MYIGSTGERGLHHLVWEVVDNSVDEALAGHCDRIVVTLLEDGGVQVVDNGRGIPIDIHPVEDIPAVTMALTMLHAGGKFGGGGYKVSGGLHGVGVSVVNALSRRLHVEVQNRGYLWRQTFSSAIPTGRSSRSARWSRPRDRHHDHASGPATDIFETTTYSFETITNRIREMAFLNKGLEIVVRDERPAAEELADAVEDDTVANADRPDGRRDATEPRRRRSSAPSSTTAASSTTSSTSTGARTRPTRPSSTSRPTARRAPTAMSLEIAMQWNTSYTESVHTFANTINTHEGGTHEEGFRSALTSLVNNWGEEWGLIKKREDRVSGDDVREGLTAIISIKLAEPQFEGQTKTKLGNTEAKGFVQRVVNDQLGDWLEKNPAEGTRHRPQGAGRGVRPDRRPQGP